MNPNAFVHLFHILIIGRLFLYVGIRRDKIPGFMFPVLLGLGGIVIVYHAAKTFMAFQKKKPFWVNLIHLFLVGPLLIFIGIYKAKTSRKYFELLLMFGFAAIGYHGYYMFNE